MSTQKKYLILLLLSLCFLLSRLYKLSSVPAWEDNFSWLYRINYYPWILETNFKGNPEPGKDLKFAGTLSYHPGVTLMTLSGISTRIGKKILHQIRPDYVPCNYLDNNCEFLQTELLIAKLPIVITSTGVLLLILFILHHSFGILESIIFGLIIILEPIFLQTSRDLHLDFLQSILVTASYLMLLSNLKRKEILSGVLFGFTLLTRFASIMFVPGFYIVFENFYKNRRNKWGTFTLSTLLTFFILYPPMWKAPVSTIKYILEGSLDSTKSHIDYTSNVEQQTSYFIGVLKYLSYIYHNISITWLILFAISVVGFIAFFRLSKNIEKKKLILTTLAFFGIYFLLLNISPKKIERYITPVIMGYSLIISIMLPLIVKKVVSIFKKAP